MAMPGTPLYAICPLIQLEKSRSEPLTSGLSATPAGRESGREKRRTKLSARRIGIIRGYGRRRQSAIGSRPQTFLALLLALVVFAGASSSTPAPSGSADTGSTFASTSWKSACFRKSIFGGG